MTVLAGTGAQVYHWCSSHLLRPSSGAPPVFISSYFAAGRLCAADSDLHWSASYSELPRLSLLASKPDEPPARTRGTRWREAGHTAAEGRGRWLPCRCAFAVAGSDSRAICRAWHPCVPCTAPGTVCLTDAPILFDYCACRGWYTAWITQMVGQSTPRRVAGASTSAWSHDFLNKKPWCAAT